MSFQNSSDTLIARIRVTGTGVVRAECGSTTADSGAGVVAINTTYHCWMHYIKGTGANAELYVYISTTSTLPSVTVSTTAGTSTTDASKFHVLTPASTVLKVDKVRVDDAAIGSAPL